MALLRCRTLHRHVDIQVRAAHLVSWAAAAAFSIAIVAFTIFLQDVQQLAFGLPDSLVVVEWSGRVGSALAVISTASAAIVCARRFGGLGGRIAHTLAVLCQGVLVLWAARWGLLG